MLQSDCPILEAGLSFMIKSNHQSNLQREIILVMNKVFSWNVTRASLNSDLCFKFLNVFDDETDGSHVQVFGLEHDSGHFECI